VTTVAIAGAGPVGLMLARELQMQGVRTVVLEAAAERSPYSKALGIHARTIEILTMRGLADDMLAGGIRLPRHHYAMLPNSIDYSKLPSPYAFVLAYPQVGTENTLESAALSAGAELRREHRVISASQSADEVTLEVDGPDGHYTEQVEYLVGCDGGRSVVRESAGIDFPGSEVTFWSFLGEVYLDSPPERGFVRHGEHGAIFVAPVPGGFYRVSGIDLARQDPQGPLEFDEFRETVIRTAGDDFGMRDPVWLTRFGDASRLASQYRNGRVFVAGDSAHIHYPAGGVGLNIGLQDALNLGWRLGHVINGTADEDLLEGYHADRHPVGQALMTTSQAQTAVIKAFAPGDQGLRTLTNDLIGSVTEMNYELALRLSGLAVRYLAPEGSLPIVGTRAPDVQLTSPAGQSLFDQLDRPRFVLLHRDDLTLEGLEDVHTVAADADAIDTAGWTAVTAALVRPDGYVAWATHTQDSTCAGAEAADALSHTLRPSAAHAITAPVT